LSFVSATVDDIIKALLSRLRLRGNARLLLLLPRLLLLLLLRLLPEQPVRLPSRNASVCIKPNATHNNAENRSMIHMA
jgi:hypothetical protein